MLCKYVREGRCYYVWLIDLSLCERVCVLL